MEFNPDGSLKLGPGMKKEDPKRKLETERCIHVRRDIVYERPPKKCRLLVSFSKLMQPFLENTFAETPVEIRRLDTHEFNVDIGSSFKRCNECNKFVTGLSGKVPGNLIEDKGTCTFRGRTQTFAFEDHFE
ncbi:MAG: hypothetical protein ACLFNK_02230 [Candidatus Woesearchaeota archaeon]